MRLFHRVPRDRAGRATKWSRASYWRISGCVLAGSDAVALRPADVAGGALVFGWFASGSSSATAQMPLELRTRHWLVMTTLSQLAQSRRRMTLCGHSSFAGTGADSLEVLPRPIGMTRGLEAVPLADAARRADVNGGGAIVVSRVGALRERAIDSRREYIILTVSLSLAADKSHSPPRGFRAVAAHEKNELRLRW